MYALHERLAELAELSDSRPDPGTASAAETRGRRYAHRRRLGTALTSLVCAVALVAIAAASLLTSRDRVEPAAPGAARGLPEEIFEPSRWLEGTEDSPPGPLSLLISTERGTWTGTVPGVVGVSATTGVYRFLDLPRAAPGEEVALSPDGNHVAFWATGPTTRSANTTSEGTGPVAAVAVFDTVTGETVRHEIVTDHGLAPDSFIWQDSDTLLLGFGVYLGGDGDSEMAQSSSNDHTWHRWVVGTPAPVAAGLPPGADVVDAATGKVLMTTASGGFVVSDQVTGAERLFSVGSDFSTPPVLDDTGRRIAYVAGRSSRPGISGSNPNRIYVATITGALSRDGAASPPGLDRRMLPNNGRTNDVLGWVDDSTIAVARSEMGEGADLGHAAIDLVDVATGESRQLVISKGYPQLPGGSIATDLLAAPSIAAPEPPRPWDPRVTTGLVLLVLVMGLLGLGWRRSVRA